MNHKELNPFKVGDKVKIVDGYFNGARGVVKGFSPNHRLCKVEFVGNHSSHLGDGNPEDFGYPIKSYNLYWKIINNE